MDNSGDLLAGLTLAGTTAYGNYASIEAATDRLVSTLVRRMCLRHPCATSGPGKPPRTRTAGPCLHRHHRRDMEYAAAMLDVLGVSGTLTVPDDYAGPTEYVAMGKREAALWAKDNR